MTQWVLVKDRMPSEEDCDEQGCVLAWHMFDGVIVTGVRNLERFETITHWARIPERPKEADGLRRAYDEKLIGKYGVGTDGRFREGSGNG